MSGFVSADTAALDVTIRIKHTHTYGQYAQRIKEMYPVAQYVEQLTFHADIHMQQQEFDYLTDLKVHSFVHADEIVQAVTYLLKKNIFERIAIVITPGACGICMHVELKSFLTLGRVKVRGVFADKQRYLSCYVVDRGDRFDNESHERSLGKMKNICKSEGYFNASLVSSFTYDDAIKVVNPTVTIAKGSQFSIDATDIIVRDNGYVMGDQKGALEKKIHRAFLRRLIKNPYNKEQLNRLALDIKEYLACKGFVTATITMNEHIDPVAQVVRLSWYVDVHHKCTVVFWGNHFFSDHKLHQLIIDFGRSAWLLPASLLAQEIERAYREKGFWRISIEIQEEKDRYFFMIKEGPRTTVEKIDVVSAGKLDGEHIIKRCFSSCLKATYFDQELLDQSFASVRDLYEKSGFLDARIVGHEYGAGTTDNACIVRIVIDEGEIKKCVGVEVPGFPELCLKEPLAHILNAKKEVLFQPKLLQEQRLFLEGYFRDQGYSQVRIESELRGRGDNEVIIVWHIAYDKTPLRFGKTVVQGSCTYSFERLMRELRYDRGHLWHQDAVKKTFLQFKRRAVFDSIYMHSDHKNAHSGEKTVLLRLHHDDPFELRMRVGLGFQNIQQYQTFSGLTYKLGSSFMFKNPTNRADMLSAQIDLARCHRELVVKYSLPWMCMMPFDGIMQGYSIMHMQPGFIGSKDNIYTVTQHGALVGIHKKTAHFEGGIHMGLEGMRTTVVSGPQDLCIFAAEVARAINFTPRLQNKMVPFFVAEPTMYLDYLDDKLNPARGMYFLLSAKGMIPLTAHYEQSAFIKVLAEQAFFVPIGSCVAAVRMRFGHIFYQQFNAIMPAERFYLGGSHSLRGYNADAAPPLGVFIDTNGKKQLVPRGGKTMFNGNGELRIPLAKGLGGVLFQDIGLLSGDSLAQVRANNIVAASGFGVRIYTPVGPLRFDIGFNWHRNSPLESRFAWFLTFGQAF